MRLFRSLTSVLFGGWRCGWARVPEALHAAWPIASLGTVCADAELTVEHIEATVWCPTCAAEQPIDEFFALTCPVCDTPTADLRHGREFEVAYIDVE